MVTSIHNIPFPISFKNNTSNTVYVQVRFGLTWVSRISYLIVHLHEKSWKDNSFNMTLEREEESDNKKIERHGMYVENPINRWKTAVWARMECSYSA